MLKPFVLICKATGRLHGSVTHTGIYSTVSRVLLVTVPSSDPQQTEPHGTAALPPLASEFQSSRSLPTVTSFGLNYTRWGSKRFSPVCSGGLVLLQDEMQTEAQGPEKQKTPLENKFCKRRVLWV